MKSKLENIVSHLKAASSGLLVLLEISRALRNVVETFQAGFDKIVRNIQAEVRKLFSDK